MLNVVMIMADTFRWDHIGGVCPQPKVQTPALEALARRSVVFDDFYAGSFPTLPNRTDLFTGQFRCTQAGWTPLPNEGPTLAQLFTEAGYRTQLICTTPNLVKDNNWYNRGFRYFDWIRGQEGDNPFSPGNKALERIQTLPDEKTRHTWRDLGLNLGSYARWQHARWEWEEDYSAPQLARRASQWLEWNHADGPFFLWLDCFDPHEPWEVPDYLIRRFDPDYNSIPMYHPNYGPADAYTKAELANLQAHYKAETALVDKWMVGHVMRKIEDLGLLENTIVAFTSDHGIYLGEHNRTGKSRIYKSDTRHWPVYEECSHIPFTLYHPQGRGGRHVKGFGQPVDIFSTLLDACGIARPELSHGISLMPQVRGEARKAPRKFALTCSLSDNPTLTTDQWTYQPLGEERKPSLYDRKTDPDCRRNVIAKNSTVAATLHKTLVRFFRDHKAKPEITAQFDCID